MDALAAMFKAERDSLACDLRGAERRCQRLAEALGAMTRERDEMLQRNDELREELADERAARREAEQAVTELQLMIARLTTPLRTGTEG